jgi:enamine deaminase RidA (YjgF/YER057c/UK114 family)
MRALPVIALMSPALAPPARRDVVRHRMPGSDLPVAMAVEVPAGTTMVHLSGITPPIGAEGSRGDTRTQARAVFRAMENLLRRLELGLGDVVSLQVFLVGVPERGGRMDVEGFLAAYREFFGTARQPSLPTRTIVEVGGLTDPTCLVEIEASAARPRS